VDDYAFYQAKHNRAYAFALTAETQALLPGGTAAALKNLSVSAVEECGEPVPKGCVSPALKKSAALQQLLAETKQDAGDKSENKSESKKKEEKSAKETVAKEGAVQILERATDGKKETDVIEKKATFYDGAELFLELSIVLCSVTLLSENKLFWKLSLVSSLAGVAIAVWGLLLH
jgi:hypothetical protein